MTDLEAAELAVENLGKGVFEKFYISGIECLFLSGNNLYSEYRLVVGDHIAFKVSEDIAGDYLSVSIGSQKVYIMSLPTPELVLEAVKSYIVSSVMTE